MSFSTSSSSSPSDSPVYLQPVYYHAIASGRKTTEGRLARGRYTQFLPGHTILIIDNDHLLPLLPCEITSIDKFPSFREMLRSVGVEACLPGVKDVEEGVRIYHGFEGYEKMEREYGVLAIGIKLLNVAAT